MIQIFTDTSANLPAAYIQKYSLRVIPLTYFVDGAEAHQDPAVDFDGKAYYDAMRSGTPVSTAMINLGAFLEPLHAALAAALTFYTYSPAQVVVAPRAFTLSLSSMTSFCAPLFPMPGTLHRRARSALT